MNARWVKWVSVAALALAGTLAVACGGDDDDDDNNNTKGKGGSGGASGSAGSGTGGSGTGGSGTGGSGMGASGAGGGGMVTLPPVDADTLKLALLNAGGIPKYSPAFAPTKWNCDATDELGKTTLDFHNGNAADGLETPTRDCANYNLAGLTYEADGWPLGAAAMKETRDDDDKIIEWSYYALKGDGTTWFGAKIVPVDPDDDTVVVPVEPDTAIPDTVDLKITEGGCAKAGCHSGAHEWVLEGADVPKGTDGWLTPNPLK
jgi:hypothetical protein